jgi:hypothetical protein
MHAVLNLVVYGRPYIDIHQHKDRWSKRLGRRHRSVEHEWYQDYGKSWDFRDPFPRWLKEYTKMLAREEGPEEAEKQMASVDHDYFDRIWDNLSHQERRYREGFFIWVLFNPKILREWAGVDVLEGRIYRLIDGREIWENCSEVKCEYQRLCRYVKRVKEKNEDLRETLERYA